MLLRTTVSEVIAVSQPAHAWISGQLARRWDLDNPALPDSAKLIREELCLAAEQHDAGFLEWERRPTLNPETGLPHSFLEMPTKPRLEIWSASIKNLLRFGRYPCLLVSHHFTGLARRMLNGRQGEDEAMVNRFLKAQEDLQLTLRTSLANDFHYADASGEDQVTSAHEFVSLVDLLSLELLSCSVSGDFAEEARHRRGGTSYKLQPLDQEWSECSLTPWPFDCQSFTVACDGRKLLARFPDENAMRRALRAAASFTIRIRLVKTDR